MTRTESPTHTEMTKCFFSLNAINWNYSRICTIDCSQALSRLLNCTIHCYQCGFCIFHSSFHGFIEKKRLSRLNFLWDWEKFGWVCEEDRGRVKNIGWFWKSEMEWEWACDLISEGGKFWEIFIENQRKYGMMPRDVEVEGGSSDEREK